jgi:hypothetical protein
MMTMAEAMAARARYSCVRCGHHLTQREAWHSRTGRAVHGEAFYCQVHAPADATPVEPAEEVRG